jgi:EAL domain-containing protein (putative c-di-GMP-specific phosphodiesterase class I)/AmiR/NasT family two-component response regulator
MPEIAPVQPPDLSALSFLVVEDDSFQRWTIEQLLLRAGAARTICAPDGKAALEALQRERFDVVVCDLDMPRMDGIELIRCIADSGRAPAVIVCTAHDEPLISAVAGIARARGVPLLDAIAKPVTAAKLSIALAAYLSGRGEEPRLHHAEPAAVDARTLAAALEGEEIQAWFQPKIDMATGQVVGGEALARWARPGGATLLPSQFLPDIQREGLMGLFTRLIARQAIRACASWRRVGIAASVSINMDPALLADESLVDALTGAVLEENLCPRDVILEVTESTAAASTPRDLETLTRLRMRGFGLAIDDFGTGYSSMLQLVCVPYTELKIDRSFVQGAVARKTCRAVVRSCADIAATLGIACVAEGVETDAEWALVDELGCSAAQGWRFGKAMPWARFISVARQLRTVPLKARA